MKNNHLFVSFLEKPSSDGSPFETLLKDSFLTSCEIWLGAFDIKNNKIMAAKISVTVCIFLPFVGVQ